MDDDIRQMFIKLNKLRATMLFSELKELGITGPQLFMLKELRDGPKTIGELAKASELSYSTVSGIIDRMERGQMVERSRDQKDRRVIWIRLRKECLKEKGFEQIEKNIYEEFHKVVTPEEIETLRSVAEKLIGILEKKLEGKGKHE